MTPEINRTGRHATASPGLHVCHACGSTFVYPRAIEEHGGDAWDLELHCPECDWTETGVFDQRAVEAFMNELELGSNQLESDLAQLIQANMADYVERFSAALAADAIHPMDF